MEASGTPFVHEQELNTHKEAESPSGRSYKIVDRDPPRRQSRRRRNSGRGYKIVDRDPISNSTSASGRVEVAVTSDTADHEGPAGFVACFTVMLIGTLILDLFAITILESGGHIVYWPICIILVVNFINLLTPAKPNLLKLQLIVHALMIMIHAAILYSSSPIAKATAGIVLLYKIVQMTRITYNYKFFDELFDKNLSSTDETVEEKENK